MLEIKLSFPNPKLNPNRSTGRHWAGSAELKKKAKTEGHYATLAAMGETKTPRSKLNLDGDVSLHITFVMPDKRRRDRDNLLASIKGDLDGIASALGIDDDNFEPMTICRRYGNQPGSVIVKVG